MIRKKEFNRFGLAAVSALIVVCTVQSAVAQDLNAAALGEPTTVDQMTCARAIAFVNREHRYYVSTYDGAIPIYPVMPVGELKACLYHEVVSPFIVKTRDQERCLVGYSCRLSSIYSADQFTRVEE